MTEGPTPLHPFVEFSGFIPGTPFNDSTNKMTSSNSSDHASRTFHVDGNFTIFSWNISNPAHHGHFSANKPWIQTRLNPAYEDGEAWRYARIPEQIEYIVTAHLKKGHIVCLQEVCTDFLTKLKARIAAEGGNFAANCELLHQEITDKTSPRENLLVTGCYFSEHGPLRPDDRISTTIQVIEYDSDNGDVTATGAPAKSNLRTLSLKIRDPNFTPIPRANYNHESGQIEEEEVESGQIWNIVNVHLRGCNSQWPKNAISALLDNFPVIIGDPHLQDVDAAHWICGDVNTTPVNLGVSCRDYCQRQRSRQGEEAHLCFHVVPTFFPTHFNPNCDIVCYDNALISGGIKEKHTDICLGGADQPLVQDLKRSIDWASVWKATPPVIKIHI